jgi:hypothetical protein
MVTVTYEVGKFQDHWRLYVITEIFDDNLFKTGGCSIDVIMSGTREECLKKKEELENEKNFKEKTKSNRKQNN